LPISVAPCAKERDMRICRYLLAIALVVAAASNPKLCPAGHVHSHSIKAPHGGELLELGGDEYHAELCVDEKKSVITVYILDGEAKQEAPIAAPYLNVNAKTGGKPVQFRLAPVRPEGQGDGPTACFAIKSEKLMKLLHTPGANPRLAMRIGKKAYVARIAHSHSHGHGETVQK
jgi:hypothetical protein